MVDADERSDVELLTSWRQGDPQAAQVLLRRHFAGIFRFFDKHISGSDVEDLTQNVFRSLIEARDRLHDDSSFRAYLYGIARKHLLKHYEAKYRHGAHLRPSDIGLRDIRTSPSGLMARADQQQLFLHALEPMPDEYRRVLEMFFWEDLKISEIAAQLGVAVGTVKSRLHRGKALLKKNMMQMGIERELRDSTLEQLESRPIDAC